MRTITVISSTRSGKLTINSSAETYGALKENLQRDLGDVSNLRAVVKETMVDLVADASVLPEGDFTLFLSAKNIKAGGDVDVAAVLRRFKEGIVDEIDAILGEIEDGEYDKAEKRVESKYPQKSYASTSLSYEDRDFLDKMKSGKI